MAETKHASEPWHAVETVGGSFYVTDREDDHSICGMDQGYAEQGANARRLVACVNACRGIPTVDLEAGELSVAFDLIASALIEYGARMPEAWRIQARATLRALGREV